VSVFVDTNVLVYAHDRRDLWIDHLWSSRDGRVNTQVLNEYYATVTRHLHPGLTPAEARSHIEHLTA
jgi:predicted nucleic acid-binding protein